MGIEIKETSNNTIKKVVGTQIPLHLYDRLRNDAEAEFMSVSDLLRKIIYLYYKDKDVNLSSEKIEREIK
jgi:hypothetical protein